MVIVCIIYNVVVNNSSNLVIQKMVSKRDHRDLGSSYLAKKPRSIVFCGPKYTQRIVLNHLPEIYRVIVSTIYVPSQ